jgi:hypothetical protein
MADRHQGLTSALAESYLEAARVCLDRHHVSPREFTIQTQTSASQATARWDAPDNRVRGAYANKTDTTETGAYACVIAAVELVEGLFAVRRAETCTGADYYLAPLGKGIEDLEDCLRLEVSGTDAEAKLAVERRLRQKVQQTLDGSSSLPALAGVVGFPSLLICIERVKDS